MERIAGLGWFVALIVVIISFALPYFWGDFSYSIASLLWEAEGALECSKVFESDEKCVRVRQELLIKVVGQNANRTKCQPDIMPTKGWHFVRTYLFG